MVGDDDSLFSSLKQPIKAFPSAGERKKHESRNPENHILIKINDVQLLKVNLILKTLLNCLLVRERFFSGEKKNDSIISVYEGGRSFVLINRALAGVLLEWRRNNLLPKLEIRAKREVLIVWFYFWRVPSCFQLLLLAYVVRGIYSSVLLTFHQEFNCTISREHVFSLVLSLSKRN